MNAPKLDFEQREQVERILQCSDDDLWNEVATLVQATAQLAEKEREIARLKQDKEFYSQTKAEWKARTEAAEQRLQEAQAEIARLQNLFAETNRDLVQANSRLRQREAELEQLREAK